MSLYKNSCAFCGTRIDSYALNRQGDLPQVFCSSPCETAHRQNKKMTYDKPIVTRRKGISTAELTQRMSKAPWNRNFGGQYVPEEQIVKQEVPI